MTNTSNNSDHRTRTIICDGRQVSALSQLRYIGLLQEFVAKLVLEVFGGGGAIWGFSEVCGFRTKETESIRFWRFIAMAVAVLFGVRWFRQLQMAFSSLLHHDQKQVHGINDGPDIRCRNSYLMKKIALEIRSTNNQVNGKIGDKSPIGIQSSSFLFSGEENINHGLILDNEEEAFLSPAESSNESTALATSPRSPKT